VIGHGGVSPVPGSGQGDYPQYHGIFYGAVSNNADPKKKNRCTLRVPQLLGSAVTTWALPLTPLVDPPKVGTLVAVMFTGGDLDNPVYLVVSPAVPIEGTNANIQPVGTTGSAGASHKVAAADHVHTLANALESTVTNIQPVGSTASAGASLKAARADHAHAGLGAGSGGFLDIPSTTTGAGGDVAAHVELFSQARSGNGSTAIVLSANTVFFSGGFQTASNARIAGKLTISPSPTNNTVDITGGNTVPGTQSSFTSTWGGEVGSTIATMYDAINRLYTTVNNIYSNLY
jgi:hypothetical protein